MYKNRKAIVLLSGGLDSTTVMAIAKSEGYEIYALTFHYGQLHKFEIDSAKQIAESFSVKKHNLIDIDLKTFGGSALTSDIDVPKDRPIDNNNNEIPITYVPARNTIFLSFALAWAEVLPAYDIFIGVNSVDYSGYPDCRPEFITAFEKLANIATKISVESSERITIHTPLSQMTKSEIIKLGMSLGVDYALTHSCYDPNSIGKPCGHCDACILRLQGFEQVGIEDPLNYQK